MAGLGENKNTGGHTCVGLEHAAGHRDDRLQPIALHQFLADGLVGSTRSEEDTVGNDAGTPTAGLQHPQEQCQEQQLRLLGLADLQQVSGHRIRIQTALEGGIRQDQIELFLIRVLVAEAVPVLNEGAVHPVGHHIHGADAEHRAIHIVAKEHMVQEMILLPPVEEDFFFVVGHQVFFRCHQETGSTASRVADGKVGLGLHQLHHHLDDMARGTELTIETGLGNLGEQILIDVAADIAVLHLLHLVINLIQAVHHLAQQQRGGQLEDGIAHVLGIGTVLTAVQILDEGKYPFLHDRVHSACVKVMEYRPLQLSAIDFPLTDFHFIRKNTLEGQAQHGTFLGTKIIRRIQIMDKHQICDLLNDIQRVYQAACGENIPQAVNSIFQFACNHINQSPCSKCKKCSGLRRF